MGAKYRSLQTTYWTDSWIIGLSLEEKFLYLYLLLNSKVTQSGIYELPIVIIEFETGLDQKKILIYLKMFEENGKIKYSQQTSEICLINFSRYNYIDSKTVKTHIVNLFNTVKDKSLISYIYGIDTIYKEYIDPIDTISPIKRKTIIKKEEKQKQETSFVDEVLENDILSFFGFINSLHPEKNEELRTFLKFLVENEKIEFFRCQYSDYINYKKTSTEKIHGFKTFLGTELNEFKDGGWCAENWGNKLKIFNENASKKINIQNQLNTQYHDYDKEHRNTSL